MRTSGSVRIGFQPIHFHHFVINLDEYLIIMDNLIIIGLSSTARHVYSFVTYHKLFNVIGFAVNKGYHNSDTFNGLPVYDLESLNHQELGD